MAATITDVFRKLAETLEFLIAQSKLPKGGGGGSVSTNISTLRMETLLEQIDALLTTMDADTSAMRTDLAAIEVLITSSNALLTGGNAILTTIDADTGAMRVDLAAIEVLITSTNSLLTTIDADTGAMVIDLAAIEVLNTTNNASLVTIEAVLDTIEVNTQASGGSTVAGSLISGGLSVAAAMVIAGASVFKTTAGVAIAVVMQSQLDVIENAAGTVEDDVITDGNTDLTIRPAAGDKAHINGLNVIARVAGTIFTVFLTNGTNETEIHQTASLGDNNQEVIIRLQQDSGIDIVRNSYLLVRASNASTAGNTHNILWSWNGLVGTTTPATAVPT